MMQVDGDSRLAAGLPAERDILRDDFSIEPSFRWARDSELGRAHPALALDPNETKLHRGDDRGPDSRAPDAILDKISAGATQMAVLLPAMVRVFELQRIEDAPSVPRQSAPRRRPPHFHEMHDEGLAADPTLPPAHGCLEAATVTTA
jgi:hypothetical protein